MSEPTSAAPLACPYCTHDLRLHTVEDGCGYAYPSTSRGRGVGGMALTGCRCDNVPPAHQKASGQAGEPS